MCFRPLHKKAFSGVQRGTCGATGFSKKTLFSKLKNFSGILSDEREGKIIQILISNILAIFFYGKPCISLTLPLEFPSLADIDYYFPSNIPKVETCAHSTS